MNPELWQPDRFGKTDGDAPFNNAGEAAWFAPRNVTVAHGMLSLSVRPDPRTLLGTRYPYSSGIVQSPADVVGPGSYVEARVAVPASTAAGRPSGFRIPSRGSPPEIDGFEFFDTSKESQTHPSFTYHSASGRSTDPAAYGAPGVDYRVGFHTYGILWDADAVAYLDGVPYPQVAATRGITRDQLAIILNLSVIAGHGPAAGSTMDVDWVRV